MTPTLLQDHQHHHNNNIMKRKNNNNPYNVISTSPQLKVNRVSHSIKRSYSTSSRFVPSVVVTGSKDHTTTTNNNNNHSRGPVIIYTHSPKVIHTNPRDFMALVQKLTGMSRPKDVNVTTSPKFVGANVTSDPNNNQKTMMMKMLGNDNNSSTTIDDNESSSVITDENCSSGTTGDVVGHLNPCMEAGLFEPSQARADHLSHGPLVPGLPFFMNNNISGSSCNSGDPPVAYDYMNYNFPYYNQIN